MCSYQRASSTSTYITTYTDAVLAGALTESMSMAMLSSVPLHRLYLCTVHFFFFWCPKSVPKYTEIPF